MAFFLPMLAAAFANKAINGGQQQQQQLPNFQFGPKLPRYRYQPLPTQQQSGLPSSLPMNPQAAPIDPITAAMMQSAGQPEYANKEQQRQAKAGDNRFNFKDEFLSNLTQGLVQRILFGGGQQAPSYSPPTWRS